MSREASRVWWVGGLVGGGRGGEGGKGEGDLVLFFQELGAFGAGLSRNLVGVWEEWGVCLVLQGILRFKRTCQFIENGGAELLATFLPADPLIFTLSPTNIAPHRGSLQEEIDLLDTPAGAMFVGGRAFYIRPQEPRTLKPDNSGFPWCSTFLGFGFGPIGLNRQASPGWAT